MSAPTSTLDYLFRHVINQKLLRIKIFRFVEYIHTTRHPLELRSKWNRIHKYPALLIQSGMKEKLIDSINRAEEMKVLPHYLKRLVSIAIYTITKSNNIINNISNNNNNNNNNNNDSYNNNYKYNNYKKIREEANGILDYLLDNYAHRFYCLLWNAQKMAIQCNDLNILQRMFDVLNEIPPESDEMDLEEEKERQHLETTYRSRNIINMDQQYYENTSNFGSTPLVTVSLSYGDSRLPILKFLMENHITRIPYSTLDEAAAYGAVESFKYLESHIKMKKVSFTYKLFVPLGNESGVTTLAMDMAAKNGHLEMVKFLSECRTEGCTVEALELAVCFGHLPVVKYLVENRSEGCTNEAFRNAVKSGHVDVAIYLFNNYVGNSKFQHQPITIPFPLKNTEVIPTPTLEHLNQLIEAGIYMDIKDPDTQDIYYLSNIDHLKSPSLQSMFSQSNIRNSILMDHLIATNQFELIKSIHTHLASAAGIGHTGFFTVRSMNIAATKGYLPLVKFLHEHRTEGCTTMAMDEAAKNGHLTVVEFLHQHRHEGCTSQAMNAAVKYNHLDVFYFLHHNRTEGCTKAALHWAVINNNMELVEFLTANRTEGCFETTLDEAVYNNNMEMVQFLHKNSKEKCSSSAVVYSFYHGNLEMVQFLFENYFKDVIRLRAILPTAVQKAIQRGHIDVIRFLLSNNIITSDEDILKYQFIAAVQFEYDIYNLFLQKKIE